MKSSISATEAKQRFGELFGKVAFGKEHVQVEKNGKAIAVMIPKEDYEEYVRLKANRGRPDLLDLFKATEAFRKRQPKPKPHSPDSVHLIRELRHRG